ncbi:hypothetical protein EVAR_50314_1 [Eumeta japonica]|uniref:Uncharacterized protein n=1 Tax=Eumeta variegata TaxID=151549 RepID=A0A4C2A0V8_EUMVA|nr:hypothetical protein EVAR_50314_1 [Eumeta japonica]
MRSPLSQSVLGADRDALHRCSESPADPRTGRSHECRREQKRCVTRAARSHASCLRGPPPPPLISRRSTAARDATHRCGCRSACDICHYNTTVGPSVRRQDRHLITVPPAAFIESRPGRNRATVKDKPSKPTTMADKAPRPPAVP